MAENKKQKKLTMNALKQDVNSTYSEKNRVTFKDEMYVDVDKYFRPSKIALAVDEMKDALNINTYLKDPFTVFVIHLLKHFTSLDISSEEEKQIICFEYLVDSGLLKDILSGFDVNELNKFNEQVRQAGIAMKQMREELLKIEAETKEELRNA